MKDSKGNDLRENKCYIWWLNFRYCNLCYDILYPRSDLINCLLTPCETPNFTLTDSILDMFKFYLSSLGWGDSVKLIFSVSFVSYVLVPRCDWIMGLIIVLTITMCQEYIHWWSSTGKRQAYLAHEVITWRIVQPSFAWLKHVTYHAAMHITTITVSSYTCHQSVAEQIYTYAYIRHS